MVQTWIQIDLSDIKRLQKDLTNIEKNFPKLLEQIRKRIGTRAKQLAKQNIHPRWQSTGQLKSSILMQKVGADSTVIYSGVPYAGYVEAGTPAHFEITKQGSKLDRYAQGWKGNSPTILNGGYVAHRHPGARPMHYMEKAFRQIEKESGSVLTEEVDKYFKKYGF